jgi:hypothetical protein
VALHWCYSMFQNVTVVLLGVVPVVGDELVRVPQLIEADRVQLHPLVHLQWCHSGVAVGLHCCYSENSVVLHCCCGGFAVVLHCCYSGVTGGLQWCYRGITVVLQGHYSGVTVVLQWCYSGVTEVLQWCLCAVTLYVSQQTRRGMLCVCAIMPAVREGDSVTTV